MFFRRRGHTIIYKKNNPSEFIIVCQTNHSSQVSNPPSKINIVLTRFGFGI